MKKYLALILVIGLVFVSAVSAQTMYNYSTKTLAWDAVALPSAGKMSYQVWSKDTVPATTGTKVGTELSATQLLMTFPAYVPSYPGVQAVFYPSATPTVPYVSAISWSTDATVCSGGVTFGILYIPTIDMIKNLRVQ